MTPTSKWCSAVPKSRIMIQLEPETIEQVDKIRGAVPRAAWVRLLIEDQLAFAERAKKYRADPELAKLTVAALEDMRDGTKAEDLFPTTPRHRIEKVVKETSLEPAPVAPTGRANGPHNREAAGSTPAGGTGKGSPATQGKSEGSADPKQQIRDAPYKTKSPSRKPKACKHTNQIRKLGRPYCTDCGEFV